MKGDKQLMGYCKNGYSGSGFLRFLGVCGALLVCGGMLAPPAYADSVRDHQWHLDAMKAEEMWKTSTGEGVVIAVIDSGVDAGRSELRGQVLEGKDFTSLPGDARVDSQGHGTKMAELIASTGIGEGRQGGYGLAPGAKILPLRVTYEGPDASADFRSQVTKAIRHAADSDARIINMSLGFAVGSRELSEAVRYAMSKDVLLFAAAGNAGEYDAPVDHPAATIGVVAVAALGRDVRATASSQHGPEVDLSAPGEEIVTSCGHRSGYCIGEGTSDATALASASAALIWSKHPDWTANQVLRVMINTAGGPTDGVERNYYIGYGAVRPRIALTNPGDPGPPDVSPLPEVVAAQKAEEKAQDKREASAKPDADGRGPAVKESASAVAVQGEDDGGPVMWAAAGAGVLVVGAGLGFVLTRRRRSAQQSAAGFGPPPSSWR
ncbi:type VII secretion-associated serine protease mycosin [Wenjunlia vitaminophila]|uniref:type VII secretion-associated serine protease mycosin n=1 Tax=Wenjunlia vitaminophila TaxID=76728 RepID=UPI001EEF0FAF|nr:type VII secretion-associated serine protease mycosin [Wenjunlia vitaminophila]